MNGLSLARPEVLWALSLALPLVLLHLYLRRRRRVLVAFAPLLQESLGPVRRARRFKRLRETTSLLARLLALALAVLALAGLAPARAATPAADLVLVVDADVTTATREAGGTLRLERALADARAWVLAEPGRPGALDRLAGRASVLLAGQAPRLLAGPTDDRGSLLARLAQAVLPEGAAADLDAAVRTALDSVRPGRPARVVVLTARAFDPPPAPPGSVVTVHGTGRARDDQGLVDLEVQEIAERPAFAVTVRVRNDAAKPRRRTIALRRDPAAGAAGAVLASTDLELPAGAVREIAFEVPAPAEPAWLEIALEGEDVFPANDAAVARLAPRSRPSLLVAHGERVRPYTAAVVEALVADGTVDASRSGFVHARDLAAAAPRDVVLVDGVPLPEGALRPGAWIFLAPLGGPLPFEAGAPIEDPLVWRTAGDHPVVADLDFRRAFAARAWPLSGAGLEPLAFAGGEPVAAEGEARGVRYVVLGLDPEASALPVQAALPLFVRRALLRLWRGTRGALAPLYHTDDPLRPAADLPGGPAALVAWSGPATDPVLAAAARGREAARIAPEGTAWRVPPGASGRATVTTRGDPPWEGRTAFFDRDPGRTVVPARPPAAPPPPAAAPAAAPAAWRRGLLAAALLLLLADVGLVWVARRGNAARS